MQTLFGLGPYPAKNRPGLGVVGGDNVLTHPPNLGSVPAFPPSATPGILSDVD